MQDYYLGLDVGTNSVGWAVTDEHYNLVKAPVKGKNKNHDMWGIRLFDTAETAKKRRTYRSSRRRLQRRKNRIALLQEIFKDEMAKVDDTFFIRLNESSLHKEDKSIQYKHPLFYKSEYTDKDYYRDYPTISHLRSELIHNPQEHDIRLVYLALHNIIKYRGNFLVENDYNENNNRDITEIFSEIVSAFDDYGISISCKDLSKLKEILTNDKLKKSDKSREIADLIIISAKKDEEEINEDKAIKAFSNLIVGKTGNVLELLYKIDKENVSKEDKTVFSINFSDSDYDYTQNENQTQREKLEDIIHDEIELIDIIKTLYDWKVFVGIMGDYTYISDAKKAQYDYHKENLKKTKYLFKTYLSEDEYKEFFHANKDESCTYSAYVGVSAKPKSSIKKCSEEKFYKQLNNKLLSIKDKIKEKDKDIYDTCLIGSDTEYCTLLPILRSKNNSTIPRQINELELKRILENASKYLPFLLEKDSKYNKTNIEKIISIFEYKIPYYVGPLSLRHVKDVNDRIKNGSNAWMIRKEGKENEYIYPWNFNDVVDKEKTNEQFIVRMTNKCTYLPQNDVLPKNSMLYQKFELLNMINNLKIRGNKINVELKQELYNKLFIGGKNIKFDTILNYLNNNYNMELDKNDLSGISEDFEFALTTEANFKKLFNKSSLTMQDKKIAEDIIRWKTIYGNDNALIMKVSKMNYPELSDEIIKNIGKMAKMKGWGNFSKEFLTSVYCEEMFSKKTGEQLSIINALWETNENLMQLLSNKYSYLDEINKINASVRGEITDFSYESCVENLYTSPQNKRAIWQTLLIIEEIVKVMGNAPSKIFVEMARGKDKNAKKTKSRKEQLKELFKNCKKDIENVDFDKLTNTLESKNNSDLRSKKLFLYYLQQGKCAYSGENIILDKLLSENSEWDIDHIYPQSKFDDNGLNNIVLVRKELNAKKSNELISQSIINKMKPTWKWWLDNKFISKEKYYRLTRTTEFSEEELSGFLARQIVETRQSTKIIADLIRQIYTSSKVIYVKAHLVSEFRQEPLNVLKCRAVNDYHHAKDAYLNIVVGDVYNTKYTDNPYKWMQKNKDSNYSITKTMFWDVKNIKGETVWVGCDKKDSVDGNGKSHKEFLKNDKGEIIGGDIERIREIVKKNTCFYTEYTYCDKGQLFNARLEKRNSGKLAIKKNLNISNYGGYTGIKPSYFALVEFAEKKKRKKQIIGVPIYVDNMLKHNENAFIEYCTNNLKLTNVVVLKQKIKMNSLLSMDGYPMRIRGDKGKENDFKNNLQLVLDEKHYEILRHVEKYQIKKSSLSKDEKKTIKINEKFDCIKGEDLISLYIVFLEKLKGPYKNRPANKYNLLEEKIDDFKGKSLEDKADVVFEIAKFFSSNATTSSDLKLLNAGSEVGRMTKTKNFVNNSKVKLINQSITGVYEYKERL
ncbi:type II CRISPR RNA-guided endonuclease Cas9 [Lachnospira multipara]|uniref:type II CRISPR RNA-guided endonuclease Cas9 n=1 Tax=Lachnospira multipara TaxID=28051 RepID=UPI000485520C|nr:type II CRISPR RNA-guided endonuclease Cas9 [Lachnospira multipara]